MKNFTLIIFFYFFVICAFSQTTTTPPSGTTVAITTAGHSGGLSPSGEITTYTNSSWPSCTVFGINRTTASCIGIGSCASYISTYNATYSNLANGVAGFTGVSITIPAIPSTGGASYTSYSMPAQAIFTFKTTGGVAIPIGRIGTDYFLIGVNSNFTMQVEIKLQAISGPLYDAGITVGNWYHADYIFDKMHTNTNANLYKGYNSSFYTVSSSSTVPSLSSPANNSVTTSASATLSWSGSMGNHPYSRYEYILNSGAWTSTGNNTSIAVTLNVGANTWQARYYDGCNNAYYTSSTYTVYYAPNNYCGNIDHGGNDWTISSSITVGGNHTNIGSFKLNSGVTATVDASCHYFYVSAINIDVSGTINANGKGDAGGAGGAYRGLWAEGGYTDGKGITSCWDKDHCRGLGQHGGYGGVAGSGSGFGRSGNAGGTGYGSKQECGWFGDEGGVVGGGGGGGGGSGGAYGGAGGAGKAGGVGGEDDAQCGSTSCYTYSVGVGGNGGSASSTYGSSVTETIEYGSGGGGGGAGGRGSFCGGTTCYSSGGSGGAGGGSVKLIASQNLTIGASGVISANGLSGGNGGDGGENNYTSGCCEDMSAGCDEQTFCAPGGGGSGAGGGSGGGIMLKADCLLSMTGTLQANGGNGGNGGKGGYSDWSVDYYGGKGSGGAGGGGGRIKIFRNPCENNTISGTISVSAGTGGSVASFGRASTGSAGNNGSDGTKTTNQSSTVVSFSAGSIGTSQTVCTDAVPDLFTSSANAQGGACSGIVYQWMKCSSGCGSPPTNYTEISGATSSTFQEASLSSTTSYVRRAISGICTLYTNVVTVSVVADPLTPTATKSPNVVNVCSGATLTLINPSSSGGTGTCNYEYQFSENGGSSWSSWSTTVPSISATTIGSNLIRIRRHCDGNGCDISNYNEYSWNVIEDPQLTLPSFTNNIICVGGSTTVSSTISGGSGSASYQWEYYNGATWNSVVDNTPLGALYTNSTTNSMTISGTTAIGTFQYRLSAIQSGNSCNATSVGASFTVKADPSAPTATKSPDIVSVCEGQILTLSGLTDNGGGTGTCNVEYRYSTNNGVAWTAWSTTPASFAAVSGNNNLIEIRQNCNGSGCDISSSSQYSWTVVSDPAMPTATKSPDVASVCEGQTLSLVDIVNNGGGTGTCNIEYRYSTNNGGLWTAWSTTPASFGAVSGSNNLIEIRNNCNGNGCDASSASQYSWSVVSQPVAQTITKTPDQIGVCVDVNVSATFSAGSGGVSPTDIYQYSINNGVSWSNYSAGSDIHSSTAGANMIQIRTRRESSGSGCSNSAYNTVMWTVYELPTLSFSKRCISNVNQKIIIIGENGSGIYTSYQKQGSTEQIDNYYIVNLGSTNNFRIKDNNECWSLYNEYVAPNLPTSISGITTSGNCIIQGDNFWSHITDGDNKLLLSIQDNGNYIGLTNVDVFVNGITSYFNKTYYLKRNYKIDVFQQPSTSVKVRLYFLEDEFLELKDASLTNVNVEDDVNDINDLKVTKYHKVGTSMNGVYNDNDFNCATCFSVITPFASGNDYASKYIDIEVNSFSELWIHGGSSPTSWLPVELLAFKPVCKGNKVLIRWITASESNNNFFTIERSSNGVSYSEIARVNGSANSNSIIEYSLIDENKPDGIVYYRLKNTDFDGKETTFNPQAINCDSISENVLVVFPNPFVDKITIKGIIKNSCTIDIYNSYGDKLYSESSIIDGQKNITLDFLNSGIYMLRVSEKSGNIQSFKIIKN